MSASVVPAVQRQRAPTITIDTSAVEAPTEVSSDNHAVTSHQRSNSAKSFDRDSRPTSPHNVSSPVALRGNDRAFLAVPNQVSRQNSVNSTDSIASETVVGNVSTFGEKSGKSRASTSSDAAQIMNDENALKPDIGKEDDFKVEDNPFAFTPGALNKMFDPKSLSAFYKLGGLAGLEKGLRTDRKTGLSADEAALSGHVSFTEVTPSRTQDKFMTESDKAPAESHAAHHHGKRQDDGSFSSRKRVFSDNRLPAKKGKSLLQLMWITYNDKVLMLLSAAAVVSLAIGLYQTFGQEHPPGEPPVEWIEGVAIIVAIVIVVLVGSLNDYQKERQFAKLNARKQDRIVRAVRSGKTVEISVFDILVGDLIHLEPGDLVPVDGVSVETKITTHELARQSSATMGDARPSHGYLSVPVSWPNWSSMHNRSDQTCLTSTENGGSEMTSGVVTDNGTGSPDLVPNNPFAYTVGQLNKMLNPKLLTCDWTLRGLSGSGRFTTRHRLSLSTDETSVSKSASFDGPSGRLYDRVEEDPAPIIQLDPPQYSYARGGNTSANSETPDEDWAKITDLAERRRIQNRIAQRNYRTKLKRRVEELEQRAAKVDGCVSAGDAEHDFNHSGKPGETKRADWTWDQVLPGDVPSQRYAASSKTLENLSWRMWCSLSPGSSSSRGTAEIPASSGGEHGGILWEKDRSKVEDEDPSRWSLHRRPQPTWDQMGAFDVSGRMEGHPNLSRPHGDTPSSLGLQPPIKVSIIGGELLDKSFFLADNEWTCYRRNYFSCVPSYSMSSPGHPNTTTQFLSSSPLSLGTTFHRIFPSPPARPGRRRSLPPFLTPLLILLAASSVSAQHPALLHIAAGTSFATSATIPPLRGSITVPAPWWIAMYATWVAAFVVFLMLELRRLPDWAQQRLLLGLFIFSGLNLTGSLVQGEDSMLEGVASWGPLAMTVSLWLVPALIEFWGVRGAGEMAGV